MKSSFTKYIMAFVLVFGLFAQTTSAQVVDQYYYNDPFQQPYTPNVYSQPSYDNSALIAQLLQQINQLQQQLNAQLAQQPVYTNVGYNGYGGTSGFTYVNTQPGNSNSWSNNNGEPDVDTQSARDIEDDSAELRGEVDMNDFRNGIVFFVYGQDEDMIEDVEDDYDEYEDVDDDEEDDDFEVVRVDNDLDDDDRFEEDVNGLEEDEDYFFIICVEYEDEDDDETLKCGDVEDFDTDDDDSNDEEPDVETDDAADIDDDSAELRGEVDMNDFNNGRVFFVWGEDEDEVEDAEDEDRYSDIDQDGDDLRKQVVQSNFSGNDNFELDVYNLDDDRDHYFRICVEYEDEDDDDTLECGDVEEFETDD